MFLKHCLMSPESEPGTAGTGAPGNTALTGVLPPAAPAAAAPAMGTPFQWPDKWKENLPEDIRGEESLKLVGDIPTLAKNYIHAQKLVGSDKIPLPGKHATEDDWKAVYKKLGMPDNVDGYTMDMPKDIQFKDEFVKGLKETALKNGILPKQMAPLLDWFAKTTTADVAKQNEATKAARTQALGVLKTEWGEAYTKKLSLAQKALEKFGDNSLVKLLNDTGLGDDPRFIKFFAWAGEPLKSDSIPDGQAIDGSVLTPMEAQKQYNQILSDGAHPYYNASHPGHKTAVEEMRVLFGLAFPEAL